MIAPRSHEHSAAITRRQPGRIAVENARGRFPRARHHGQRAGQFAVPSDEWMQAASAVAKLETVVALLHHVEQAARRTRIGVVVNGEQVAALIKGQSKRVPKAGRHEAQFTTVGFAAEYISAFAAAAVSATITAFERIFLAQIFPQADVEPAVR